VMVSLAEVWRSHGVEPAAVVGHSQGEIAAACVAGALSLDDAARVVALRSRILARLAGRGGMVAVALPAAQVEPRLTAGLSVAAVNGPTATVVSGDNESLAALLRSCETDGVRARRIEVDYPSHAAPVAELRDEILAALAPVAPRSAAIPFYSTVTGEPIDTARLDAEYWYTNLRDPVRFEPASRLLAEHGHGVFVEVSPHPVLVPSVQETAGDALVVGTLRRDDGGPARLLASLAELHVRGVPVDWTPAFPDARRVELPTYPFQHRRYWLDAMFRREGNDGAGHPVVDTVVRSAASGETVLTGRLSVTAQPWLAGHVVDGAVLLPASTLAELALAAGDAVDRPRVESLTLTAPLVVPDDGEIQVVAGPPEPDGRRPVAVFARERGAPWSRHADGTLTAATGPAAPAGEWPPAGAEPLAVPAGNEVRAAWRCDGDAVAAEVLPAVRDGVRTGPLDAAVRVIELAGLGPAGHLPFCWAGMSRHGEAGGTLRILVTRRSATGLALRIADGTGAPVLTVDTLTLRPRPAAGPTAHAVERPATRRHSHDGTLRERLSGLDGAERDRLLLDLVRGHAASVLGHDGPDAVPDEQAFAGLGFDSVTGVELRNRLNAATGLRLPPTLVFDYPSPAQVAGLLLAELAPEPADTTPEPVPAGRFDAAGDDEMFRFIDGDAS
jgi:malonyl CoA-acyl carrier protein transacylase/acyl carrier protein